MGGKYRDISKGCWWYYLKERKLISNIDYKSL